MTNLPENYQKKMKDLLQDQYGNYLQSFSNPIAYGLRINTTKISVEDFLKISPFHLKPIPWTTNGFYYDENDKPSKHPFYYAGLYYLQEPSAMIPAQVLPIEEGDLVLDACAAPGGKSTEILNKLNGSGCLISNDISASRAQALLHNIEKWGCQNVFVASEDISKLSSFYPDTFDKILIDAPCSGEGMFHKDPSLIKSWIERGNQYYVSIQKEIVRSALHMLKEGGQMVYSTCTFSKEENEDIIDYMLSICPQLKLLSIDLYDSFERGIQHPECIRIYPHKVKGEGHFTTLLQKGEKQSKEKQIVSINSIQNEWIQEFFSHVNKTFSNGTFEIRKEKLYFIPNFNTKRIRLLRSGLYIGDCKKNRFEPSQAFAMHLKKEEFDSTIDFSKEDERVIRYLKGETIQVSSKLKGWVLICVEGYPLGFGKIDKGMIKNKYAQGWRWK